VLCSVVVPDGAVNVHAPDLHDLAFSKLAAGRSKDIEYVRELLRCNLIGSGKLKHLIEAEADLLLRKRLEVALILALKKES
jgi:hypothetical protein